MEKKYPLGGEPANSIVEVQPSVYPVPPPYFEGIDMAPHPPQAMRAVVQNVYSGPVLVGPMPASMECPSCRQAIVSRMTYDTNTKTHLMAGLLCVLGCCLCAWFPYVMNSCKNANHYCPNCNAYIGTYSK